MLVQASALPRLSPSVVPVMVRVESVAPVTPPEIPSEEVATRLYPPELFPIRSCPKDGAVEVPVPPPVGNSIVAEVTTLGIKRRESIAIILYIFFILVLIVS